MAKVLQGFWKSEEKDMKNTETEPTPIAGAIEPDFLDYLKNTFKEWQQLKREKVTLGSRSIGILRSTINGAKLNSLLGFEYKLERIIREEDNQSVIRLMIYTNPAGEVKDGITYTFEAEIYE